MLKNKLNKIEITETNFNQLIMTFEEALKKKERVGDTYHDKEIDITYKIYVMPEVTEERGNLYNYAINNVINNHTAKMFCTNDRYLVVGYSFKDKYIHEKFL